MHGFDNGPPDGDFVRYIDTLLATSAAAAAASVVKSNADFEAPSGASRLRELLSVVASAPTRDMPAASRTETGFAQATGASASAGAPARISASPRAGSAPTLRQWFDQLLR